MEHAAQLGYVATRFMRLPEVCTVTGLRRTMIYRLQQESRFPRSVKITNYAVGWIDAEVHAWVAQRVTAKSAKGLHRASNSAPSIAGSLPPSTFKSLCS